MDDVKIRAIVDKPNSAYAHWRIVRPYTMLQSQGIDADWCWLDDKNTPLDDVDGAVIVLQRTILGTIKQALQFIEHLRSLKVKAIVYELDDDTLTQAYIRHMKMCGRILDSTIEKIKSEIAVQTILIQQCDAVTVSTLELKIIVEEVFNGPIYVVHNAIDVDWFTSKLQPLFDGKADGIVTIGWAGGLRPRYDLEPMAKAWGAIEKTHDNVRFVVAGWQPDVIYENVDMNKIVRLPWADINNYPTNMQVDIGCCALEDTCFNKCKSQIKALEYGLAGATVVASNTVYSTYFKHCLDCMLLENIERNWHSILSVLVEHEEYRTPINDYMQATIRKDYSLENNWKNWLEAYEAIS